jgi:hypothetical protein
MPGDPLGSGVTDAAGHFSISVPGNLARGQLLLVRATVDRVKIHALVTPKQHGRATFAALTTQGAAAGATEDTPVDPISDAAVTLLDEEGLENYSDDGINAVIESVGAVNATTAFDGLTVNQAVDVATTTAASSPLVQITLQDNRMTPTPTTTSSPTPSATPTPMPIRCVGDCDGSGTVTVDEIIMGVDIDLDTASLSTCPQFDANHSGTVTVTELILGVNNALGGCD